MGIHVHAREVSGHQALTQCLPIKELLEQTATVKGTLAVSGEDNGTTVAPLQKPQERRLHILVRDLGRGPAQ